MSEQVLTKETKDLDAPEMKVLDVMDLTSYGVGEAVVTRPQTVKAARPTKQLPVLRCIDMSLPNHWLVSRETARPLTEMLEAGPIEPATQTHDDRSFTLHSK